MKKNSREHLSVPSYVILYLTHKCNFRCQYCGVSALPSKGKLLSITDIKNIFDQCQKLHIPHLLLTGGEPLLRRDISDILRLLKKYTFQVRINTNGTCITEDIADQIKEARVSRVDVSLDGPKRIHESLCQSKNSYNRVVAGIERLKRRKIFVGLNFVPTALNLKHFYTTLEVARDLRVDVVRVMLLSQALIKTKRINDLLISYDEWKAFFNELTLRKVERNLPFSDIVLCSCDCDFCHWLFFDPLPINARKRLLKKAWGIDLDHPADSGGSLHCNAGIRQIAINAYGDVYPCDQMYKIRSLKCGNIRRQSLFRIWHDAKPLKYLRGITRGDLSGPCGECVSKTCSGPCRGEAYNLTDNLWSSDLNCPRVKKKHGENCCNASLRDQLSHY